MTCRCGAHGAHPAGTGWLCAACFDLHFGDARAAYILERDGCGTMRQVGPLRAEYGGTWAECECSACGATAVTPIGEPCGWCVRWLELAHEVQRRVLLRPDLPDVDDPRRQAALRAWALRLAEAVKAEIVTKHEARAALDREEPRHVA